MRILVVGAGRMGSDVGTRFARSGLDVVFVERDARRREAFAARLRRTLQRAAREGEAVGRAEVPDDGVVDGTFDALWEAVDETPDAKRAAMAEWAPRVRPDGLVLSNSSSILPSAIDARCIGLHAFHPSALTGFCEVIVPDGCPPGRRRDAIALAARIGLDPIVQDESSAFAVNRLMLPGQDVAVRAVARGADPEAVDAAAVKAWPSWEPLAMMDAIGLDTVAAAVAAYRSRMPAAEAASYEVLEDALRTMVAAGRHGARDGGGFRTGGPLPWGSVAGAPAGLRDDLESAFRGACERALSRGELDRSGLSLALSGLFGIPYGPASGDGVRQGGATDPAGSQGEA